ncbi:hypothetical protein [Nonomuraea basaltis]|uniref:hypothetical protein n=1 Tax=Nonomuraea basaltis TaxID=2495887 RepID=UPI00110C4CAB|nr:hypothetical protein [Nonomuraea basaltis]TMR97202.1 hypothetical protein EJK15_19590 [Nonomuraea basaltis]
MLVPLWRDVPSYGLGITNVAARAWAACVPPLGQDHLAAKTCVQWFVPRRATAPLSRPPPSSWTVLW